MCKLTEDTEFDSWYIQDISLLHPFQTGCGQHPNGVKAAEVKNEWSYSYTRTRARARTHTHTHTQSSYWAQEQFHNFTNNTVYSELWMGLAQK
jgi:hypothetical protein